MSRKIEIIVSTCTPNGDRTTGNTIRETFSAGFCREPENIEYFEQEMRDHADPYRQKGFSVIVRPMYNKPDNTGFYEWRSFNGSSWERCDFDRPF